MWRNYLGIGGLSRLLCSPLISAAGWTFSSRSPGNFLPNSPVSLVDRARLLTASSRLEGQGRLQPKPLLPDVCLGWPAPDVIHGPRRGPGRIAVKAEILPKRRYDFRKSSNFWGTASPRPWNQ
jgi:hypothetical protein